MTINNLLDKKILKKYNIIMNMNPKINFVYINIRIFFILLFLILFFNYIIAYIFIYSDWDFIYSLRFKIKYINAYIVCILIIFLIISIKIILNILSTKCRIEIYNRILRIFYNNKYKNYMILIHHRNIKNIIFYNKTIFSKIIIETKYEKIVYYIGIINIILSMNFNTLIQNSFLEIDKILCKRYDKIIENNKDIEIIRYKKRL